MAEIEENIRSEELDTVLGTMPNKLIRKGSGMVFLFFISLIVLSFIIKFPDTINGRISISTQNPPARLVAQANGRLNLFIKEGDKVVKNKLLAVIENSASIKDVLIFESKLNDFKKISENPFILLKDSSILHLDLNLGEIHTDFVTFKNACRNFIINQKLNRNEKNIFHLQRQYNDHKSLKLIIENRLKLMQENNEIIKKQYQLDSSLYQHKSISKIDLDETNQKFLDAKQNLTRISQEKLQNELELKTLEKLINESDLTETEDNFEISNQLRNSFRALITYYDIWQQKYFLKAPTNGEVTFFDFWNENQFVRFGNDVMAVITKSEKYVGRVYVGSDRLGKIELKQKVKVKLDSYPYSQYGIIYGEVINISELNRDNTYIITVAFPKGLFTSYKKQILFKEEMQGNAEIITEDTSIIERLMINLRKLFNNN